MARFINPVTQYGDSALDPLIDGKLFFFESGSATLKDIFSDVNESIPLANPVILTGDGSVPNIFFSGSARVKLTDSDDVQRWDKDPVGGDSGTGGGFSDWNSLSIYSIPDYVIATDDRIYCSIVDNNQGNEPSASLASWSEVKFIVVWNPNETYDLDDVVQASDALLYKSNFASNTGNDPSSDAVNWSPAVQAPTIVYDDPAFWMNAT